MAPDVSDSFSASAKLRWITLERGAAPTIVELRGKAGQELFEQQRIMVANTDVNLNLNGSFDFAACGDPCMVELEVAWHHGHSGELRVDWNADATRNAWREEPYGSRNLAYRVTPVDFATGRTKTAAVIAADPDQLAEATLETATEPEAPAPVEDPAQP